MKKIFILLLAIAMFGVAFGVFAKTITSATWYKVDEIETRSSNGSYFGTYQKTYDEDTNVVCYALIGIGVNSGAISCVKNN